MDNITLQQLMKANEMYERRKLQNREAQKRYREKNKDDKNEKLKQYYHNAIKPAKLKKAAETTS